MALYDHENGGMSTLTSDKEQPGVQPTTMNAPLSGAQLDKAIAAMESPGFLSRLTARIVQLAGKKGFWSPFRNELDLPGGKSVGDLAAEIVEKTLDGSYTWDENKMEDFEQFCLSRAESILSNWLDRTRRTIAVSPTPEADPVSGDSKPTLFSSRADGEDIYQTLCERDGGALGDRFLEDFALSLADASPEQAIVMAVFDDRSCAERSLCREKLKLSEAEYDAAVKRLLRKLPEFQREWRSQNGINPADWREAQ